MYEQIEQSAALPLNVFAKEYGTKLPQVIVVHESLYGVCPGSLRDGQKLEVHFRKETSVVVMKLSRKSYTVPVNSSFKFSILYNPNNDLVKARRGYLFETVTDLMKAVPLPNLVYVGKECTASLKKKNSSIFIQKCQLLIIKGIESHFGKGKWLKCVAINDSEELYLKDCCEGQFSTRESLLLFPLSVLIKKQFQFPVATSLYSSDGRQLHIIFNQKSALIDNALTTLETIITTSNESTTPYKLTELCTTLPIEVHVTNLSETAMTQLNQRKDSLLQVLSPEYVTDVVYDTSAIENMLQKDLLLPMNNKEWVHEICSINATIYEPLPTLEAEVLPPKELPPPLPSRLIRRQSMTLRPLTPPESLQKKKPDLQRSEVYLQLDVLISNQRSLYLFQSLI